MLLVDAYTSCSAVQGVGHLDTEMGTLRNLLTNSAVLVNALKEVAQPSIKPTLTQPKQDGSAPSARTDVDWAQTTDGLRYAWLPLCSSPLKAPFAC